METLKMSKAEEESTGSTKEDEEDSLKYITRQNKCLLCLRDNVFTLVTLGGVGVGFALGFGVRAAKPSPEAVDWIGEFYLLLGDVLFSGLPTDCKTSCEFSRVIVSTWLFAET
ncbi:unnamed protein product [Dibothriocephalus latus]|uniref:Uncharacterized protein n=1 Tax=Dibothriocephalus latus TaxID=60516 RepID=A0A3P7LKR3_DIBLA|nr:unnamed protein product [Dibothriocephalus latus]